MDNQNTRRWFNDRRFSFNGPQRVRNQISSLLTDLNQVTSQNPELVTQLHQQLTRLRELLNNHQPQTHATAATAGAPSVGTNAVLDVATHENSAAGAGHTVVDMNGIAGILAEDSSSSAAVETVPQTAASSSDEPTPPAVVGSPAAAEAAQHAADWQRVSEAMQSPEIQLVVRAVFSFLPFLVILLVKAVLLHISGLLVFLLFGISFIFCDAQIRKQVSARGEAHSLTALYVAVMLMSNILVLFTFFSEAIYLSVALQPPEVVYTYQVDLLSLLWLTCISDFVVKFVAMTLKCFVILTPRSWSPYKRRGRVYRWIEVSAHIYRFLVPMIPWTYYLLSSSPTNNVVYGSIAHTLSLGLVIAYVFFKWRLFRRKLAIWWETTKLLLFSSAYGTTPKAADVSSSGGTCSICFGDYKDPIQLSCQHIFCDDCITSWFETSGSCPMCRKEIIYKENVSWKDGSTNWTVQLY